jgi:hypothetical protein
MAIPSNISTITVNGKYLDFSGNPIAGQVKFYMSQVLIDAAADRVVIPSVVTVDLDATGSFTTTIPVTNDPDFNSTFTYLYEESFVGGSSYALSLPATLGSSVNIASLRATATIVEYIQLVSYNLFPGLVSRVVVQEEIYNGPSGTAVGSNTYQNLYLFINTYSQLTSTYATYAELANPEFNFNEAAIQSVLDRISALYDYTADTGELRDTTNGGVVSGTTYPYLTAKYGTYGGITGYSTYADLTGANISWNYSQIGAVLTNLGYALTDTGTLTDPYLSITRTTQSNTYGGLEVALGTYATFATTYATYADSTGVFYSIQGRDTADTLRRVANQPNRLLFMGREN